MYELSTVYSVCSRNIDWQVEDPQGQKMDGKIMNQLNNTLISISLSSGTSVNHSRFGVLGAEFPPLAANKAVC